MEPETRYARAGDVRVAYQVVGDGPRDLVCVPGFVSNLELAWEHPPYERFMRRLSAFARVIVFDKRGSGLSDPIDRAATIEERIDDIRAVMDAVGFGAGGPVRLVGGREHGRGIRRELPRARVGARPLRSLRAGGSSRGTTRGAFPQEIRDLATQEPEVETWGTGLSLALLAPSRLQDETLVRWWGRFERQSMSPAMALDIIRLNMEMDIREVLPSIRVPTLVIHTAEDVIPVQGARWLAEQIPDAQFVELPGDDHWPWITEPDASVDEVEQFLTGVRHEHEPDRVLTTVLFTDIVESTERAAALGDKRWRDLLQQHDRLVRRELDRHRGREVKTIGRRRARDLRRAGPGDRLCAGDLRTGATPSGSRFAPASTPVRSSSETATSAASPCTSARGWRAWRGPGRCSSRARSRTSSSARAWSSRTGARTR